MRTWTRQLRFILCVLALLGGTQPVRADIGDIAKGIIVYVSGRPWISEAEIDRIVGDPKTLQPGAVAKLKTLPPRLRLRLYTLIADRAQSLTLVNRGDHPGAWGAPDQIGVRISIDGSAGDGLAADLIHTAKGHFTDEELIDLGVYLVSQLPFFPQSDQAWQKIKHTIVNYDVWLALAVVFSQAASDTGTIGASGWLVKLGEGDRFRLGWYGSASHLGFSLKPSLKAGVKTALPGLEASAGVIGSIGAAGDAERFGIEGSIREHWLEHFSKPLGWMVWASASGHATLKHGDPEKDGTGSASLEVFARKEGVFESSLAFMLSANASSDLTHRTGGELSVALEDSNRDLTGILKFGAGQDHDNGKTDYSVKLFVGGTWENRADAADRAMVRYALLIEDQLTYLEARKLDFQLALDRVDDFGTGRMTREEEKKSLFDLRVAARWIRDGRHDLSRYLDDYLMARTEVFRRRGVNSTDLKDADGYLEPAKLQAARNELRP